jgi:hypothetical protein
MRFKLNDKVIIKLRDETVEGLVSFIDDYEFTVVDSNGETIGTFPNDVGNYVQIKE